MSVESKFSVPKLIMVRTSCIGCLTLMVNKMAITSVRKTIYLFESYMKPLEVRAPVVYTVLHPDRTIACR